MEIECIKCGCIIPKERLEVLPKTLYCKECAEKTVKKNVGFMSYFHKTAPVCIIVDPSNQEALRKAVRCFRRGR